MTPQLLPPPSLPACSSSLLFSPLVVVLVLVHDHDHGLLGFMGQLSVKVVGCSAWRPVTLGWPSEKKPIHPSINHPSPPPPSLFFIL